MEKELNFVATNLVGEKYDVIVTPLSSFAEAGTSELSNHVSSIIKIKGVAHPCKLGYFSFGGDFFPCVSVRDKNALKALGCSAVTHIAIDRDFQSGLLSLLD